MAVPCLRLAVEDIPEQFVADLDRHLREVFRDRRGVARHGDVVVVHLPGVGNDRDVVRLAEIGDLLRRGDAADPVDVELGDVDGPRVDELAEAVERVFVLAAGDRHGADGIQFGVAGDVVGDHRLFQPAHVEGGERPDHPPGVFERPAAVAVGHDVDGGAGRLAHRAHEVEVVAEAGDAVLRSPAEAELHGAVALVDIGPGLGGELIEGLAVEPAGIDRDVRLGAPADQPEDRLAEELALGVPDGEVDGADRGHADALAAIGERAPVHRLPEIFAVHRVLPDEERLQVGVDHRLGGLGRQRRIADADGSVVELDLDHEPAEEAEAGDGAGLSRDDVGRRGAEMRRHGRNRSDPLPDRAADILDGRHGEISDDQVGRGPRAPAKRATQAAPRGSGVSDGRRRPLGARPRRRAASHLP